MNVPEFNLIAERVRARPIYRAVVLSAHGMRSRGEWQKVINGVLTDAGFRHNPLEFGHISARKVPLPGTATRAAKIIADAYYQDRERAPRSCAIAHSFGTIALTKALQMNPTMSLDRVVLWGSVVRARFPWAGFVKRRQVSGVLNEACRRDPLPYMASVGCVLHGGGWSGNVGFKHADEKSVFNRFHTWTNHSRLGTAMHCEDTWIPFLQGDRP